MSGDIPETITLSFESVAYLVVNETQWDFAKEKLFYAMGDKNVLGLDVEHLLPPESQPVEYKIHDSSTPNDDIRRRNINRGRDPLLQLGAPGIAVLVRLCYFDVIPESLVELLSNRDIIKVGVEILDDAQRLKAHWKLRVRGCMDLRCICMSLPKFNNQYNYAKFNLKSIGAFLNQNIDEADWKLKCSDWSAPNLSFDQIEYAANDALAAVGSYIELIKQYAEPPSDCEFDSAKYWAFFKDKYMKYVNRPFNEKSFEHLFSGNPDKKKDSSFMKPKAFRKLADKLHCSDSDLDFDFDEEVQKRLEKMEKEATPSLTSFYPEGQNDNQNYTHAPMIIETDLLKWARDAQVPNLKGTLASKVSGINQRYRVTIELIEDDQ